ncbi:hypothetical protein AB0C96_09120 [Streptomyces sp. NPDC048506]|uniref:hypothetical protein n=1 Tax=Streptomyces sp. NPDC048506 TaxID=3155028 RepID=UPI003449F250
MPPITLNRDAVLNALEAAGRPLQRYDLVMTVFWAAGYDRTTYRTVQDLPDGSLTCVQLIDRLHAEGELIRLPSTKWRQILGTAFDATTIHGQRGYHWFATRDQHTCWTQADHDRAERITAITARLSAANLPPLALRRTGWSDNGALLDADDPEAVYTSLEIVEPHGARVAEVLCTHAPDDEQPADALADAEATADLLVHAPTDLAFLLTLINDEASR